MDTRNPKLNDTSSPSSQRRVDPEKPVRTWPGLVLVLFVAGLGYVALGGPGDVDSTVARLGGIPDASPVFEPEATSSIAEMATGLAVLDTSVHDRFSPSDLARPVRMDAPAAAAQPASAPPASDAAPAPASENDGNVMTYEHD